MIRFACFRALTPMTVWFAAKYLFPVGLIDRVTVLIHARPMSCFKFLMSCSRNMIRIIRSSIKWIVGIEHHTRGAFLSFSVSQMCCCNMEFAIPSIVLGLISHGHFSFVFIGCRRLCMFHKLLLDIPCLLSKRFCLIHCMLCTR